MRIVGRVAQLLLLSSAFLCAQEYRATVLGTVTDPGGAIVPGAKVVITNKETGVASRTQSNANGAYQVPYLQPGTYTLDITHPGFKTYQRGPIDLHVDDHAQIDVALEIGRSSEQVTVTAE